MTKIKIKINSKGEISADYIGFVGNNCNIAEGRLKKMLDEMMKIKTKNEKYKDRQYEEEYRRA